MNTKAPRPTARDRTHRAGPMDVLSGSSNSQCSNSQMSQVGRLGKGISSARLLNTCAAIAEAHLRVATWTCRPSY
jgi:hypothetical protein